MQRNQKSSKYSKVYILAKLKIIRKFVKIIRKFIISEVYVIFNNLLFMPDIFFPTFAVNARSLLSCDCSMLNSAQNWQSSAKAKRNVE